MAPSSLSSSDHDDSLAEDLAALSHALTLTGASASAAAPSPSDSDPDSDSDDLDLLRSLQARFCSSSGAADATSYSRTALALDDDSDDDLATLRAIQRRFSQYDDDLRNPPGEASKAGLGTEFPRSAKCFVEALTRNRECQRFIRRKLIEIEAKFEENKGLKERVKCLMEFQVDSKRKAGSILGQKQDPRVRLVSMRRTWGCCNKKQSSRKVPTICFGPLENPCVSDYKLVMKRFPTSVKKQTWSNTEKDKLARGIKQQYQELVVLNSMSLESNSDGFEESNLMHVLSSSDLEVTPEKFRSFLPFVNWDRLASMYLTGRSGAECEARWLNCEDPMINRNPWTILEEKKLLFIVQERGVYNWIDIAIALGTQRTPFQCLVRYQRSLNPHILKKDWTEDEDAVLRAAVENFGDNWQLVASSLEGRTGTQCSNRWRKSILPDRRKVGRWSVDEDKRLKVAVMLFGAKNWNKIAHFAPGRTQVQCRERWLNCLDPSLKLEAWTAEEDVKLLDAIKAHGYCWSKVATCVPPRTDSQCRRRWKILLPHEVPLLQEARQIKKTVLISNFVDRESERPAIGPSDLSVCVHPPLAEKENSRRTRMKRSSDNLPKKSRAKQRRPLDENLSADDMVNSSADNALSDQPPIPWKDPNTIETGGTKRKRNRTSSGNLPKKSRAKSSSHENFVADVVNAAENAPTDLSHVLGKDPNIITNEGFKRRQNRTPRAKPRPSLVNKSTADGVITSSSGIASIYSFASTVASNVTETGGPKNRRKPESSTGSRVKIQTTPSCEVAQQNSISKSISLDNNEAIGHTKNCSVAENSPGDGDSSHANQLNFSV